MRWHVSDLQPQAARRPPQRIPGASECGSDYDEEEEQKEEEQEDEEEEQDFDGDIGCRVSLRAATAVRSVTCLEHSSDDAACPREAGGQAPCDRTAREALA